MSPVRLILAAAIALTLAACQAKVAPVTDNDMSMGSATAPVTLVEYASVACPVCARWNNEVFEAFKKKYVDTGQVRYVAREAATHNPPLAAAGFLLARCAGKDKYFKVVDDIYHAQAEIETSGQAEPVLRRIARGAGLSDEQFSACTRDPRALAAFQARTEAFATKDKINSTPTFVINGKVYDAGFMSLAEIDAAIAEARTRGRPAS